MQKLTEKIKEIGRHIGFSDIRITDLDLKDYHPYYRQWVARGFALGLDYMVTHGDKRLYPQKLFPQAQRAIVVRLDYHPPELLRMQIKDDRGLKNSGLIARYSLGRDYHKVLKAKLKTYRDKILELLQDLKSQGEKQDEFQLELCQLPPHFRAFVDSAPLLEKPLAEKAGIGWQGKNSLILNKSGSWFFLGNLLTSLPLTVDQKVQSACAKCRACEKICPTQAISSSKFVDTKRCIAYLTIENKGSIPEDLRPLIGNRIFGCDDCQLICPWNRFAKKSLEQDFFERRGLAHPSLPSLASLTSSQFDKVFQGSAVMRAGFECFLRNVAVALGNAEPTQRNIKALKSLAQNSNLLVREHAYWALSHLSKNQTTLTAHSKTL